MAAASLLTVVFLHKWKKRKGTVTFVLKYVIYSAFLGTLNLMLLLFLFINIAGTFTWITGKGEGLLMLVVVIFYTGAFSVLFLLTFVMSSVVDLYGFGQTRLMRFLLQFLLVTVISVPAMVLLIHIALAEH